jgi:hypothetical protein
MRKVNHGFGEPVPIVATVAVVRCHWRWPEAWLARASCRPIASAIRRIRGSSGSPERDPLSLAGQSPFRSFSTAIPMLPRQGPSNKNNEETQSGSWKFEPSSCGVGMLAGSGYSLSSKNSRSTRALSFQRSRLRKGSAPFPISATPRRLTGAAGGCGRLTHWKTGGPGRIFREWRQLSDAIAAPSTDALKQSSWYRIRVTRSAGLR